MSLSLFPPKTRIQEIAYQTTLPYYSSTILEEYESVMPGSGERIFNMILKDIEHLENSKVKWEEMESKIIFSVSKRITFEQHLARCGFNTSGKYMGKKDGNY